MASHNNRANKNVFVILSFLAIIFLFSPTIASANTLGCCIDEQTGVCSPTTQGGAACTGDYYPSGCPAVVDSSANQLCELGCCCAQPTAPNPGDWNTNEENMYRGFQECAVLGDNYAWEAGEQDMCAQICGQIDPVDPNEPIDPTDTYTLTGLVLDENDEPIEDATVRFPNNQFQAQTNSEGVYNIQNIPSGSAGTIIASSFGCAQTSFPTITLTSNQDADDISMNCNPEPCTIANKPTLQAQLVRGEAQVRLSNFVADSSCEPHAYFHITRLTMNEDDEVLATTQINPITSNTYADTEIEADTKYCYKISAVYPTAGSFPTNINEQEEACVTTGAAECMQGEENIGWCDNTQNPPARFSCDENNQAINTPCNEGQLCTQLSTGPVCIAQPPCDKCNGLFGILSHITYSVWQGGEARPCNEISHLCFEDRTTTITNAHKACSTVVDCNSYKSTAACEDNPCNLADTCSWTEILEETNTGICQSTNKPATCEACEDLFGSCSQTLCEGISNDCYFDATTNGLQQEGSQCIHKDNMACRFYDTQEECEGTQNDGVRIDVTYNAGVRTSGTHEATSQRRSNDLFDIGVCRWRADSNYCYKDADGRIGNPPRDDCMENEEFSVTGRDCLRDATPPTTTLILTSNDLAVHELARLSYIVTDNFYTNGFQSFFCIDEEDTCYPNKTLRQATSTLEENMNIGDEKTVYLRYYSKDRADNLEVVQSEQLNIIHLGVPFITTAEIVE